MHCKHAGPMWPYRGVASYRYYVCTNGPSGLFWQLILAKQTDRQTDEGCVYTWTPKYLDVHGIYSSSTSAPSIGDKQRN